MSHIIITNPSNDTLVQFWTPFFTNGLCSLDRETIKVLYDLEIGQAVPTLVVRALLNKNIFAKVGILVMLKELGKPGVYQLLSAAEMQTTVLDVLRYNKDKDSHSMADVEARWSPLFEYVFSPRDLATIVQLKRLYCLGTPIPSLVIRELFNKGVMGLNATKQFSSMAALLRDLNYHALADKLMADELPIYTTGDVLYAANEPYVVPLAAAPVVAPAPRFIPPVIPESYNHPTCATHVIPNAECCGICSNGPNVILSSCGHYMCASCYVYTQELEKTGHAPCPWCRTLPTHYTFVRKEFVKK